MQSGKTDDRTPVDIGGIKIDTAQPVTQRMQRYLEQIENPYCFRCGEMTVTVEFCENGKPLDRLLIEYFANLPPAHNTNLE